jgi:hypothetical protein
MRLRALGICAWPWTIALVAAATWLILPAVAPAQSGADNELGLPSTSIAPAGSEPPVKAPPAPVPRHHSATTPIARRTVATKTASAPVRSVPVEPAEAKLLLKQDSWIYAQPSNRSAHLEQGERGKFVKVTGTTHYFLRVKLKDGQDGYVPADAVQLTTPADKLFMLTHDAPVLDAPNHWGKKLSEVHQGHAVHVVGIALSYMKIRMKSGLEGYIPASALE